MQEKMEDPEFTNDMQSLLRPGITFNADDAYPLIYETFIDRIEGKRDWKMGDNLQISKLEIKELQKCAQFLMLEISWFTKKWAKK